MRRKTGKLGYNKGITLYSVEGKVWVTDEKLAQSFYDRKQKRNDLTNGADRPIIRKEANENAQQQ